MYNWVYEDDDFGLVFLITFLGVQSLFSFLWFLRIFSNTPLTAILFTGFFVFLSLYFSYAVD